MHGGVSRRCLTSPHGGPAGSKNGAAALLGGNGADLLHGAGEPHGGWTELGGAGSRRGAGGAGGGGGGACMRRGTGPQGCLLSTSGFSSQRLYCHQGAGRAPEAARVQGAVAGGRMHCRRRCRAAAGPARPAPDRRQWPTAAAALTRRPRVAQLQATPLPRRWAAGGEAGGAWWRPRMDRGGRKSGGAAGQPLMSSRAKQARQAWGVPGACSALRPADAIRGRATVHRRAEPQPKAPHRHCASPTRPRPLPAAPPLTMAAPQVAHARAVLGLGVRAAQATEVKHQAAKQFFKEVGGAWAISGPIAGCCSRRTPPCEPHTQPSACRRPPAAARLLTSCCSGRAPGARHAPIQPTHTHRTRRSAAACPGWWTTTGWMS